MSAVKWNSNHITKFLKIYKQFPVLWNTKLEDYSNMKLREEVFKRMCEELENEGLVQGMNKTQLKSKIKGLKDVYRQELSKIERSKKNNTGEIYTPKLVWFGTASYFGEVVTTKDSFSVLDTTSLSQAKRNNEENSQSKESENEIPISLNSQVKSPVISQVISLNSQVKSPLNSQEKIRLSSKPVKKFKGQTQQNLIRIAQNPDEERPCDQLKICLMSNEERPCDQLKKGLLPDEERPYDQLRKDLMPDEERPYDQLRKGLMPDDQLRKGLMPDDQLRKGLMPDEERPHHQLKKGLMPDLESLYDQLKKGLIPDEERPYDQFGKYVAAELRQLPQRQAILLQQELQNFITNAKLSCLEPENSVYVPYVEEQYVDLAAATTSSALLHQCR